MFFDFDYTLADSSEGIVECMSYALDSMGFPPVSGKAIKRTIGLSLSDTYRLLTGSDDPVSAAEFVDVFVGKADEIILDRTRIFDGVEDVLINLRDKGLSLGIISTKFRYRIEDVLRREGLIEYFDVIIGGEDVAEHKPSPEGLNAALSQLGVSKDRALYIGDSVTDAETARNAGVSFAAVLTGVTLEADFEKFAPVAVTDDLNELFGILNGR